MAQGHSATLDFLYTNFELLFHKTYNYLQIIEERLCELERDFRSLAQMRDRLRLLDAYLTYALESQTLY